MQLLNSLESRIKLLESKATRPPPKPASLDPPPQATDSFSCKMLTQALSNSFKKTRFVRCPDDYYVWPLEKRRKYLAAPTTGHLTKSIVFHNTRFSNGDEKPSYTADIAKSQYVCCIVPYGSKINSDRLRTRIREMFAKRGEKVPPIKAFNYRLVDCLPVTGYEPNGVTPLGMKTSMPVVIDRRIVELDPPFFWLGGGEVSLKWRVELDEFVKCFAPVVLDVAEEE